nr:uncharacterized protein LOC112757467 [Arachis hypogaea]
MARQPIIGGRGVVLLKLELPKGLLGAMPARCTLPCHPLGTLASTLWLWCAAGVPRPGSKVEHGCRAAETRVAQRLAGRNASKMHDALPSPRHTSKPVVVVVCRRGPPPRVQGRARASGCRTPRSPKDQEGKHVHARPICAPPSEHGVVELCLVHPRRARLTSMVDARRCPTRCWFCCAGCLILDGAAVRLSPEAPHASGCPLNVLRRFPRTLPSGVGSALPYASACRHAPRRAGGCSSGRAGFADRGGG